MLDEIFPTLERAFSAARKFLCDRDENTAALDEFRVEVGGLKIPPDRIRAVIETHLERMHNIGQIPLEKIPELRAKLQPYALSYSGHCFTILGAKFDPKSGENPVHTGRLTKLANVVREERKGV